MKIAHRATWARAWKSLDGAYRPGLSLRRRKKWIKARLRLERRAKREQTQFWVTKTEVPF